MEWVFLLQQKLCPHLRIVKPNGKRYKEINIQMRRILKEYDPNHEAMSLDEAALDVTEILWKRNKKDANVFWTGDRIANEIRERIHKYVLT
jgi:nucleotidyltransferase/DNA polymerase involved in DNA repair